MVTTGKVASDKLVLPVHLQKYCVPWSATTMLQFVMEAIDLSGHDLSNLEVFWRSRVSETSTNKRDAENMLGIVQHALADKRQWSDPWSYVASYAQACPQLFSRLTTAGAAGLLLRAAQGFYCAPGFLATELEPALAAMSAGQAEFTRTMPWTDKAGAQNSADTIWFGLCLISSSAHNHLRQALFGNSIGFAARTKNGAGDVVSYRLPLARFGADANKIQEGREGCK